ncbi:MAG: hypothetical protein HOI09_11875, partial [Porticoccaceae bacterium]|nr:hypothetical protein [Porticoccaceae bacterium]
NNLLLDCPYISEENLPISARRTAEMIAAGKSGWQENVPGSIKERIISRDAVARTMVYSCFESPTPLDFHEARVEVIPAEQGCTLYWQTLVEPVEIEVFIKASMEGCLVQIGQVIEQS